MRLRGVRGRLVEGTGLEAGLPDDVTREQVHRAGLHLAELLRTRYKSWKREVTRTRREPVHVLAVATVLARYLHHHPRAGRPSDRHIEPASLTTTVSRALAGTQVTLPTVDLFAAAFGMSDTHADQLRGLLAGTDDREVVIGLLPPPAGMPGYREKEFDTLVLHEHHWLGPDGLPVEHRSQITLRSRVDGLTTYQYRIDTPHAEVTVDAGGTVGELTRLGDDIWSVDLAFAPVRANQIHYVEFRTRLRYDVPPEPVVRRGTHELIENVDLRVQFHPDRLPSAVRFTEWGHYQPPDDRVLRSEELDLDDQRTTHRFLAVVERAVVGFAWEW